MLPSGIEYDPSQVVVTNGGKHAVFTALAAVLDVGDEVLLPAPYWTTYPEAITLAGGVPVGLGGLSVTPDGRTIVYGQTDRRDGDLVMVSPRR